MREDVFDLTLQLLKELCNRGTQKEVNMNGNGESFLDPNLVDRVSRVKKVVGERQVCLSTNGINLTSEKVRSLKGVGLDRLDISPHSPFRARKALEILRESGMGGVLNVGPIYSSHNWAGQLEPEKSIRNVKRIMCIPLQEGRGYVQAEGTISPCCYDFRNLGTFASVFDRNALDKPMSDFSLCKTCHQIIDQQTMERMRS